MRAALLSLYCFLLLGPALAQRVSLRHLMRIHSADDSAIYLMLRQAGWAYRGIQYDVLRKPRMFALNDQTAAEAKLYLYSYHRKPLCKLELVCSDVQGFNRSIRDSLHAYGFVPDLEHKAPEEENLKTTSSTAFFVNNDTRIPVHALILYYQEKRRQKVSLTIYGDQ